MLDLNSDSYTGNFGAFEINKETEVVSSKYTEQVALPADTTYYNLESSTSNDIAVSEIMKEIAQRNYLETGLPGVQPSENAVLTVDLPSYTSVDDSSNKKAELWRLNVINTKRRYGCDNSTMHVPTSDEGSKKYCCIYCLEPFSKLVRHLMTAHKEEEDVKNFEAHPIGSKQRRVLIDKIRIRGQFERNQNGDINKGILQTSRRPNKKFPKEAIKYTTCANCYAQLHTSTLRYHWNKCTKKALAGERIVNKLSCVVERRMHADTCQELIDKVFPSLVGNKDAMSIRFDWIVITFANDLCTNYDEHFQVDMIRTYLRNAGKILLAARTINSNVSDFASLYDVKNCNSVIETIRTIAKFDSNLKIFGSPATASALVTLMNKIGEVLLIEYMKLDYEDKEKSVERFLRVFQKDARFKINKLVTITKSKASREKDEIIPSTNDVQKLADYMDVEREAAFNEMKQKYTFEAWLHLSQLTMISVLVFNRKRVGDIQNIVVSYFHRRKIITEHTAKSALDTVPEETKKLIKSLMLIRGKLYRTVSVLLTHSFDDCLALLLHHREDAGVPETNNFLFGLPVKSGKIKTIDGGALLRKYSKLCGAENPASLRGTKLGIHFATMCGTQRLSDNDVTNVAKFMGHSEKIHRDVYRRSTLGQDNVNSVEDVEQLESCNVKANPKRNRTTKPKETNRKPAIKSNQRMTNNK